MKTLEQHYKAGSKPSSFQWWILKLICKLKGKHECPYNGFKAMGLEMGLNIKNPNPEKPTCACRVCGKLFYADTPLNRALDRPIENPDWLIPVGRGMLI